MNTCKECSIEKPWSEFKVDPRYASGYRNTCKECLNVQLRARASVLRMKGDSASVYLRASRDSDVVTRLYAHHVVDEGGCWLWTGTLLRSSGYGQIGAYRRGMQVHRLSLVIATGMSPQPDLLDAGHICHDQAVADGSCFGHACQHRLCIRPDHLAWQTPRENVISGDTFIALNVAKEFCARGHPLSLRDNGGRMCLVCHRVSVNDSKARRHAAAKVLGVSTRQYELTYGYAISTAESVISGSSDV